MTSAPLSGRTALVTGASRGIGRELALRLAAAGAAVAITARSEAALKSLQTEIEQNGGRALALTADLLDPDEVTDLVRRADDELGPLDLLVSNCGVPGPTQPLWEVSPEDWRTTLDVNVTALYLLCRAALPAMIERQEGSVVVIGSASGKRPLPLRTPYATSKTALIGFVRTLAWEVAEHGLRVNLISPGPVSGERLDRVIQSRAEARGLSSDELRDSWQAEIPLRRFTAPVDVANAVVFLAGNQAQGITGEDLNVSGGWVMYG